MTEESIVYKTTEEKYDIVWLSNSLKGGYGAV